jgi:hypothetical protein
MQPLTVSVEVDPGQPPARGRVHIAGERDAIAFTGWVELVQVLERLRAAAAAAHGYPGHPGDER